MTLSSMRMATGTTRATMSRSKALFLIKLDRLIEPRLHTAVSCAEVLSVISVHGLLECPTPTWSCGERTFDGSFHVIHGWPDSNSMVRFLRQRSAARIFLWWGISPASARISYLAYASSNLRPYRSWRSGTSEGLKSV